METVTISLNGREVAGPPGTTILDLATQVGVEIPTLCHHPLLKNAGACRVCLVEDLRTGKLLASCVTPILEGMEIVTHSPAAVQARRGVLELILSDHPSACVVCSKGNECVLRSLAKDHGICDPELEPIRRWRPMEEVNPFIVRDLTKCVLCGRCIRVCKDYEVVGAVEYTDRGYTSHPGTADRTPLEGSECNFCGSCVAICPTDALAERDRATFSSGKALAPGICSYCGTGCHLEYEIVDGQVAGARGVIGSPVNSLSLCVRGHYGQDAITSPGRLTDPLVRDGDGTFRKSSWEDAVGEVAVRLNEIRDRHGPSSIGVIAGTQCSNEELYLAGRFCRSILRTPKVDATSSLSSGVVVEGLVSSLKEIGPGASIGLILEADTIVMIDARPDYTHPVIARNVRQAVRNNGASLIQLDPLTTSLDPFTHLHFKEEIGSQPGLLIQLIKELVAGNLHDEEFVLQHVMNAEDFLAGIKRQPNEQGSSEKVAWAAAFMGGGRKTVFLLGPLVARATQGYIITRLVADLAILCGQPHHIRFLFEGCNEMGTWELGCTSARPSGCLGTIDPSSRVTLQDAWGTDAVFDRGLDAMSMLQSAENGDLKGL
ncbi:MAG: molybdopterin-dependent oxidoreductase, partial [Deltaproteobacteria bacterium]